MIVCASRNWANAFTYLTPYSRSCTRASNAMLCTYFWIWLIIVSLFFFFFFLGGITEIENHKKQENEFKTRIRHRIKSIWKPKENSFSNQQRNKQPNKQKIKPIMSLNIYIPSIVDGIVDRFAKKCSRVTQLFAQQQQPPPQPRELQHPITPLPLPNASFTTTTPGTTRIHSRWQTTFFGIHPTFGHVPPSPQDEPRGEGST